ncbi:hypothetical protein DXG01_014899 [Tephrocybe rancida]|nr:hypothetical protein DXG01_014899 [Tephrocybe rancida]
MSISVYLWAMFMMLDTFKITSTIGLLASSRLVNKRLVKWNLVMFWLNLLPVRKRFSTAHYSGTHTRCFVHWQPVLNDGIIIWRAWTISGSKRWALYICNALWITSAGTPLSPVPCYVVLKNPTLCYCMSATTLAVLIFDSSNPEFTAVAEGFDMAYKILNTASALLSFATNMLATGLIGYILW